MMPSRSTRDKGFSDRFHQACDLHGLVPAMNHGRQTWVREEMKNLGVDVSLEAVRKWSSGETRPKPDKMKMLARLLRVNEEWLSLGIDTRNAAVNGFANMVTGFLQMAGAHCAFPDAGDPQARFTDLYAIICNERETKHKAINVAPGHLDGDRMRFQAPAEYEDVVVLGVILTGFSRAELFVIPSAVIKACVSRGGHIEVEVEKSGSEWAGKGGSLLRIRKLNDIR